jgi:hypothetical protein
MAPDERSVRTKTEATRLRTRVLMPFIVLREEGRGKREEGKGISKEKGGG